MVILLFLLMLFSALQAVHAVRLLDSVLWLASLSVFVSILLYGIGAWEIAVIELSIGAGLVTVLLIFAITMVGEKYVYEPTIRLPALTLAFAVALFIVTLTQPHIQTPADAPEKLLTTVLWEDRGLDMIGQVVLIFAGVLGVLGLLSTKANIAQANNSQPMQIEAHPPKEQPYQEVA